MLMVVFFQTVPTHPGMIPQCILHGIPLADASQASLRNIRPTVLAGTSALGGGHCKLGRLEVSEEVRRAAFWQLLHVHSNR